MEQLKARILHTMLRVKNLENSIHFYTKILGMTLLRRNEFEQGRFTLAFVGYGKEDTDCVLELTFNWDETDGYDLGKGYGHIALGVPDIYLTCERLRKAGAKITREPGPMKHGSTIIAFVQDPDGYQVELIEKS